MTGEENKSWRQKIIQDLQARNKRECETFALLVTSRKSLSTSASFAITDHCPDFLMLCNKSINSSTEQSLY